jgi:hypothetical protein
MIEFGMKVKGSRPRLAAAPGEQNPEGERSVPSFTDVFIRFTLDFMGKARQKTASVALFPLAIPLISGPGLLTVMFITNGDNWLYFFRLLFPALVISLFAAFVTLRCSTLFLRALGSTGIFVMEKIMGLILPSFAVQFVYNGLGVCRFAHKTPKNRLSGDFYPTNSEAALAVYAG